MSIYHALINTLSTHIIQYLGEWGGECGKQVGSMNEESQVSGCYSITFIYTNQETV